MSKTAINHTHAAASAVSFIGLAALGGAVAGFFLQLLVAYHFGASGETDAYFMAQSASELVSKLLLGGSIAGVFLPMFVERLAAGEREQAWRLGLNIVHLVGLAMVAVLAVLFVFAEQFVRLVAPGFDAETAALTVHLLRVLLPSFLFLFVVDLLVAMLHSLRRFAVPASLRLVAPVVSIILVLALASRWGIYALAAGMVAGSLLQLVVVLSALARQGFRYRFIFQPADPAVRGLLWLVYPFIFSALVTQGAGVVHRILVSELAVGSLSALRFAEKITQLLTIMFLNSVTIVVFPLMSERAARGDVVGLRRAIGAAIRLIAFVLVPLTTGVALLREPLIHVLFVRGSFTPDDAALTGVALFWLAIGLTTNGISSVLGHATLALKETRAAVAVTIATQALALSLFVLLAPRLGLAGLALAATLTPLGIALLYFLYLTRFIPNLGSVFWHPTLAKALGLSAGMGVLVFLVRQWVLDWTVPGGLSIGLQLVLPTILGMAVYGGGAYLWGVGEMRDVIALVRVRGAALWRLWPRP